MFSEESWGNPPGGFTCLLVPVSRENKPSNTLMKSTGSFHLDLEIWVSVVVYPDQTSRPGWRRSVA